MKLSILDKFLEAQLLPISPDDETYGKLEEAAKLLAKHELKKLRSLPRFILAGLDPNIPEIDPCIQAAKEKISIKSRTILSRTNDAPINLLRAILLEGVALRVAGDFDALQVAHLVGVTYSGFYKRGREEGLLLGEFWRQIVGLIHEMVREKWDYVLHTQTPFTPTIPEYHPFSISKSPEPTFEVKELLTKATLPKNLNGENTASPYTGNHSWGQNFVSKASEGFLKEFQRTFEAAQAHSNSLSQSLEQNLVEYIQEYLQSIELSSQSPAVSKLHFQTQMLWWKEALYSKSLQISYREVPKASLPLTMSWDIVSDFPMPYPASVEHFLAETFLNLKPSSKEINIGDILQSLLEKTPRAHLKKAFGPPQEFKGRSLLTEYGANMALQGEYSPSSFQTATGIDPESKISPMQLCLLFFREFQVHKICQK